MILGRTTSTFTFVHVLLNLAGIGSGFIVIFGLPLAGGSLQREPCQKGGTNGAQSLYLLKAEM